jgi:hypothetical protein
MRQRLRGDSAASAQTTKGPTGDVHCCGGTGSRAPSKVAVPEVNTVEEMNGDPTDLTLQTNRALPTPTIKREGGEAIKWGAAPDLPLRPTRVPR